MHSNGFNETAVGTPSRILVVEDDPVIGRATSLALREAGGFAVELCDRGGKTLRWARRFRAARAAIRSAVRRCMRRM